MADIPANPKLYNLIVSQAKMKYDTYPSPGASHWVHKTYIERGGKFVHSQKELKREPGRKAMHGKDDSDDKKVPPRREHHRRS